MYGSPRLGWYGWKPRTGPLNTLARVSRRAARGAASATFVPASAERTEVRLDTDFLEELAGLATTAFFETGVFLFDADFFADGALFLVAALPEEVFFFEVLFLLAVPADFAVFLRDVLLAFFAVVFLEDDRLAAAFLEDDRLAAAFLEDDRLVTFFFRPAELERLTVFFREVAPAAFLLLLVFFVFFLAAAFLAGICLASKRDYKKSAIIHTAGASGSL
jgi:hypothetical protein